LEPSSTLRRVESVSHVDRARGAAFERQLLLTGPVVRRSIVAVSTSSGVALGATFAGS